MASILGRDKMITGHLKRIIGNPVGELIPLYESEVAIGRSKKSNLCIHDPNVSRNHCTLKFSENDWFITDLGGVNGTYLDNKKLTAHSPVLLTDGLGIYLGPPAEAPYAFVFIKTKEEKTVPKKDPEISQSRSASTSESSTSNRLQTQEHPTLKRKARSTSHATASKKPSPTSTVSCPPASSQATTTVQCSDEEYDSDTSINSLDSLRTRIRKLNSTKKKKRPTTNVNGISTSASPIMNSGYNRNLCESAPSTSTACERDLPTTSSEVSRKVISTLKSGPTNMFKELDTLFTDGSDSLPEISLLNDEDSESLLNEADQQNISTTSTSNNDELKTKLANLNQQLKIAHHKLLQENAEQKQKLDQLMEESTNKSQPTEKLSQMIEEELICNICTEVFIKATTLACSHTFCEHCINEWQKKQKRCPMCREPITSSTRILIMDNFIDKVVDKLDKEYQDKRKEVIAEREQAKLNEKVKKKKRKKSVRRNASRTPPTRNNPSSLRQLRLDLLSEGGVPVIDIVSFFTPCYICGQPGHREENCPHR